jgi:signal transduction histidine kinase/CheY-like chemotaxis protein
VSAPVVSISLRTEQDVVFARQRARQVAALVGLEAQDQARIATAVSEIARNALTYAGGGQVTLHVEGETAPQLLTVSVQDQGPGIADLPAVLEGRYRSRTGLGLGLIGARRLMDRFEVSSDPGRGTRVVLRKFLPRGQPRLDAAALGRIASQLRELPTSDALAEVHRQNQELLRALGDLQRRQEELEVLNRELQDTNRGVVALYAELDEKADHLRRADELKSRFLSNMSHEFRTPVNSIQSLARLLLARTDGELTREQERQVAFIRTAADSLSELVNDLLDLAKVEAGKTVVNPGDFEIDHLFGTLRGMLRPLLVNDHVVLVFEEAAGLPILHTDEAKVSQILRNFISNALKFTERGEVRVSARLLPERAAIEFSVADTGIGIAAEDQERIFDEFTQLDSPLQRRLRGTGLGLPLCRRLAGLLGGSVSVESALELGSTFRAVIPVVYPEPVSRPPDWKLEPGRSPVLVVEDSAEMLLLYERMLEGTRYQLLAARTLAQARDALASFRPAAIVLDIRLRGEESWGFLAELKRRPDTLSIPVAVATMVEDERKALALGADRYLLKPLDRAQLLRSLAQLLAPEAACRVLLIDDDEIARYLTGQHLRELPVTILEESTGHGGLRLARAELPDVIFLDLGLEDLPGSEVLRELKADPATCRIPVIVLTGRMMDERERAALLKEASAVLVKHSLSRAAAVGALERALDSQQEARA